MNRAKIGIVFMVLLFSSVALATDLMSIGKISPVGTNKLLIEGPVNISGSPVQNALIVNGTPDYSGLEARL